MLCKSCGSVICLLETAYNSVDIICDGPVAQSLGVEPRDTSLNKRPPRKKDEPIITLLLVSRVLLSSTIIVLGTLIVFFFQMDGEEIGDKGRTMVLFSYCFTC